MKEPEAVQALRGVYRHTGGRHSLESQICLACSKWHWARTCSRLFSLCCRWDERTQRSSCVLPYTLPYPLWSPTSFTLILQPLGEVSDFKLLLTCLSLAFFCNLNYAVCSKRNSV